MHLIDLGNESYLTRKLTHKKIESINSGLNRPKERLLTRVIEALDFGFKLRLLRLLLDMEYNE